MKDSDVRAHVLLPAHVRFELKLEVARVASELLRQLDFLAFTRSGGAAARECAFSGRCTSPVKRIHYVQLVVFRSLGEPNSAHAIRRRDMHLPRDVFAGSRLSVKVDPRLLCAAAWIQQRVKVTLSVERLTA